ncbi:hypothetical protein BZA77DRAFT_341226 [Pyronema omphalodes]|nr:hypothetical protein BZA77DRAFT_341226 [Pyronema omphalodes]
MYQTPRSPARAIYHTWLRVFPDAKMAVWKVMGCCDAFSWKTGVVMSACLALVVDGLDSVRGFRVVCRAKKAGEGCQKFPEVATEPTTYAKPPSYPVFGLNPCNQGKQKSTKAFTKSNLEPSLLPEAHLLCPGHCGDGSPSGSEIHNWIHTFPFSRLLLLHTDVSNCNASPLRGSNYICTFSQNYLRNCFIGVFRTLPPWFTMLGSVPGTADSPTVEL